MDWLTQIFKSLNDVVWGVPMIVLILGTGALQASLQGLPATGQLLWLASLAALATTLTPFAIAAGLKISLAE